MYTDIAYTQANGGNHIDTSVLFTATTGVVTYSQASAPAMTGISIVTGNGFLEIDGTTSAAGLYTVTITCNDAQPSTNTNVVYVTVKTDTPVALGVTSPQPTWYLEIGQTPPTPKDIGVGAFIDNDDGLAGTFSIAATNYPTGFLNFDGTSVFTGTANAADGAPFTNR